VHDKNYIYRPTVFLCSFLLLLKHDRPYRPPPCLPVSSRSMPISYFHYLPIPLNFISPSYVVFFVIFIPPILTVTNYLSTSSFFIISLYAYHLILSNFIHFTKFTPCNVFCTPLFLLSNSLLLLTASRSFLTILLSFLLRCLYRPPPHSLYSFINF
jgi:hypothetical protein